MPASGPGKLFDRIGRVAVVAVSVMTAGIVVAYSAEHPVNPEFATWVVGTVTGRAGYQLLTELGELRAQVAELTGLKTQMAVLAGVTQTKSLPFRCMNPASPGGHFLA